MTIKLGIIMDPISQIHYKKDSTLAMMMEAQRRGWEIHYIEDHHLYLQNGKVYATTQSIEVKYDADNWFHLRKTETLLLQELDVILMRKDPPFSLDYIYLTYLLEIAEKNGTLIINKPQSLRDCNEKVFTAQFPQCCPNLLISNDIQLLKMFAYEQKDVVFKPLHSMGGNAIFRVKEHDTNLSVIIETLTNFGQHKIMAQTYIPEISQGDKRILMINGEPIPYALARIPAMGDGRGNLAQGAQGVGVELSLQDRFICQQVGPILKEKGLIFVGLDVIGSYLTEINVTSPTCIRELDHQFDLNIAGTLFDCIEEILQERAETSPSNES